MSAGAVVTGPDFGGLEVEVIFDLKASLGYRVKRYNALCKMFVWTDKEGEPHTLKDIDDNYLQNIINFLKRNLGEMPDYDVNPYNDDVVSTEQEQDELDTLIKFLEKVQHNRGRRGSYASKPMW